MLPLWYSPIYTEGLDPASHFPRERYRLVRGGLEVARSMGALRFHEPKPLATGELKLVHDDRYVEAFLTDTLDDHAMRRIGLRPWTEDIVTRTLILTNGTVEATRHVLKHGGMGGNVGGGTHHAYRGFGSGYCIFNDLALAARIAQRDFGLQNVLILDLDVHQGDGTASIFEKDPSVRTISFHCGKNFPSKKMQSDRDVVFDPGAEDEVYLRTLKQILQQEKEEFRPELILFQGGVDGLATDRLGLINLTREGLRKRNELVFSFVRDISVPLVITMGGGYSEPIAVSVRSHVDLFLQAAGFSST